MMRRFHPGGSAPEKLNEKQTKNLLSVLSDNGCNEKFFSRPTTGIHSFAEPSRSVLPVMHLKRSALRNCFKASLNKPGISGIAASKYIVIA
jgi:hypothetical protein